MAAGQLPSLRSGKGTASPPSAGAGPSEATPVSVPASSSRTLREILALSDPVSRIRALVEYAERLPSRAIADAVQEIPEGSPEWDPEAKMVMPMLLTRWARGAPEAAYASLAALDPKRAVD